MLKSFSQHSKHIFASSDSRYYLSTAFKFTMASMASYLFILYSLWMILDMNFNFFVANGFSSEQSVFYDKMFVNLNEYLVYFLFLNIFIFSLGLLTSYLIMRPFDALEFFAKQVIHGEFPDYPKTLKKNYLVFQVSRIFFKYLETYAKTGVIPAIKIPPKIESLKAPTLNKFFIMKFTIIISVISLTSSTLIYSFSVELYQEIVSSGLELLKTNYIISSFLDAQDTILSRIYFIAILSNVLLNAIIAKKMIATIDGVSYAISAAMIKIIKGHHSIRISPRKGDPGQSSCYYINRILDQYFSIAEEYKSIDQEVDEVISNLDKKQPQFDNLDDLKMDEHFDKDYQTMSGISSNVVKLIVTGQPVKPMNNKEADHDIPPPFEGNKKAK